MHTTTDEWAIDTVEVAVPERYSLPRAPLLVDLPCPPLASARPQPSDFECEVMQTAELARCMSLPAHVIRVRARRFGWYAVAASAVTAGTIAIPVAIWFGTLPVALAAGFGWQWAVLTGAAERLERGEGRG